MWEGLHMHRWKIEATGFPRIRPEDQSSAFAVRWLGLKYALAEADSVFSKDTHDQFSTSPPLPDALPSRVDRLARP
eukprot:3522027-Pyramimonas_sp.AAC.1